MNKIETVGQLKALIKDLDDDFNIDFRINKRLSKDDIIKSRYPYPYKTAYVKGFEFDDIGYSDKDLCLSVVIPEGFDSKESE